VDHGAGKGKTLNPKHNKITKHKNTKKGKNTKTTFFI
jgi:hypothetical protein